MDGARTVGNAQGHIWDISLLLTAVIVWVDGGRTIAAKAVIRALSTSAVLTL